MAHRGIYEYDTKHGHTVYGLPGWETFVFSAIRIEVIDGIPRLIGVNLQPVPGAPVDVVTLERTQFARFPVAAIIAIVAPWVTGTGDTFSALRALGTSPGSIPRPRGGSVEFSRAVAAVVQEARALGESTVQAVAATWHVSDDRANQYIRDAKRHGVIEGDGRTRPKPALTMPGAALDPSPAKPANPLDPAETKALSEIVTKRRTKRSPGRGSTSERNT